MNRKRKFTALCLALFLTLVLTGAGAGPAFAGQAAAAGIGTDEISAAVAGTAGYLLEAVPAPTIASIGGEWTVIGLSRMTQKPDGYTGYVAKYEQNALAAIKDANGVLTTNKYTEYSRVILAFTAIGKDPAIAGGYDLVANLADFSKVKKQGLNGPIYALLALDSAGYTLPSSLDSAGMTGITELTSREALLTYILGRELSGGGFALGSSETQADADVTAMALQALAPYQERADVAAAIERALPVLSAAQTDSGAILFSGEESSESTSQVITALTALGIDPETDSRFQKAGADGEKNGLVTGLLRFQKSDGSFCHSIDGGTDLMATEQSFLALVAYERFLNEELPLFQMTDSSHAADSSSAQNESLYQVSVNGTYLTFDQSPVIKNGRLLVPMSAIFQALGAEVSWDAASRTVTAAADGKRIILTIGQSVATVDGTSITLDAAATIENSRTMVPLRFIAEALDAEVVWDPDTKTATITR